MAHAHQYLLDRDKQRREIKPPQRYAQSDMLSFALSLAEEVEIDELVSYKEARRCKNKDKWLEAMNEEIDSLNKDIVYKLQGTESCGLQMDLQGERRWNRSRQGKI